MKLDSYTLFHREFLKIYSKSRTKLEGEEIVQIAELMRLLRKNVMQFGCIKTTSAYNRYVRLLQLRLGCPDCTAQLSLNPLLPRLDGVGNSGISIVTCSMNRSQNLLRVLPSWLRFDQIKEVVIVDWSSQQPVRDALDEHGFTDNRIKVVRVKGESRWILSYAFNVGFRVAKYSTIMKIDADIVLNEDYFKINIMADQGTFVAGNHKIAKKGQEHINGFLVAKRETLANVGGYSEYITRYGWDDDDLYNRLAHAGLKRVDVYPDSLFHIPHTDSLRTGIMEQDHPTTVRESITASTRFLIHTNRNLCNMLPAWNGQMPHVQMEILQISENDTTLMRVERPEALISEDLRAKAAKSTLREILSWDFGSSVWQLTEADMDALLDRPVKELTYLDIEVALADRSQLPTSSGRYMVLVPDASVLAAIFAATSLNHVKALGELLQLAQKKGFTALVYLPPGPLPKGMPVVLSELVCLSKKGLLDGLKRISREDLKDASADQDVWMSISIQDLIQCGVPSPIICVPRRKLFIDAQHGLGNRLRALGSAAAIADATDMELVVVWQPDDHCDCRFTDLFEFGGAVIDSSFFRDASDCHVYNYMTIEGGVKNVPIRSDMLGDTYVRSAFVLNSPHSDWARENRFIQSLHPVDAVLELVQSVRHPNDVSVHVRMEGGRKDGHLPYESASNWSEEDHDLIDHWRLKSHFSHFMKRIDTLILEGRADRIFIAADKPETYEAFLQVYSGKLTWLKRIVYDRSADQLRYALADAILLSRAPLMLGSTWSSFSELAQRLATGRMVIEMSGMDF